MRTRCIEILVGVVGLLFGLHAYEVVNTAVSDFIGVIWIVVATQSLLYRFEKKTRTT